MGWGGVGHTETVLWRWTVIRKSVPDGRYCWVMQSQWRQLVHGRLRITDHGEEVGMVDRSFLGVAAYIVGFVQDPGDRQTKVGAEQVHDHRVTDVRRLRCKVYVYVIRLSRVV